MNRIAIVTALAMAGNVHLCAADVARAGTEIDFAKIPDVRIFKGDETIGYREFFLGYKSFECRPGNVARESYVCALTKMLW